MDIKNSNYDETLRTLADMNYQKILFIDVTADRFDLLCANDFEWEGNCEELPEERISEWFKWFADGPLCHDNDRDRFRAFADLDNLINEFEKTNYDLISIVYRRRSAPSEQVYSTVIMELLPKISDEGHVTAFLFVRNITAEIQKYNDGLKEIEDVNRNSQGRRTVLIVEDNDMNREILAEILSEKYNVLQAENGAVGLEILQKYMTDISVVVLDVQMPVMNGYEFLDHVQKDPFLSEIPVVVATGSDSLDEEYKCLDLGASDFVTKPYRAAIIMSRIAGIIRLKESAATMSLLQTDALTGLYTLQAFHYYTRLMIDRQPDTAYTVTVFDIDHFNLINENYGDGACDEILHRVADIIRDYAEPSDIYGRFGDDRFLLLSETRSPEETEEWINGLFETLQSKCGIRGMVFKAGIYDDVDRNLSVSAICDRAIMALNSCGQSYRSIFSVYDETHAEKERRLAVMEADMQKAYDDKQFAVYYQPKHDAKTGKLVGAEALIRWIHPEYGFLSPAEFIPLFEQNGFVTYADYYVLERTCSNLREWTDEGIAPVPVSINSSRRDFEREDYLEVVLRPLKRYGIDPSLLHLEVTESLFSDNLEEMSRVLQSCREAGFSIELDDFGAGYSSLTTLAYLPLDVMKLDMSFMRNYKDERKLKILMTCIGLAKSLGLKVVSEGVENEEQLELLKQYGCDWIQGYYFSKPLPENEFKEYLIKYTDTQR